MEGSDGMGLEQPQMQMQQMAAAEEAPQPDVGLSGGGPAHEVAEAGVATLPKEWREEEDHAGLWESSDTVGAGGAGGAVHTLEEEMTPAVVSVRRPTTAHGLIGARLWMDCEDRAGGDVRVSVVTCAVEDLEWPCSGIAILNIRVLARRAPFAGPAEGAPRRLAP